MKKATKKAAKKAVQKKPKKMNEQFFRRTDLDKGVAGLPRELVGYGEHPPRVRWGAKGAKVAINIVINYEEGSEKTFAMGDRMNDGMYELPFAVDDQRDLAVESMYEYGSRAGIWRMLRVFDSAGIPVTFFGCAVALERNPAVAAKLVKRGDDVAGHGLRWSNHYEMTRDEEREAIKQAIASIKKLTGARPLGWYCREMSTNTRELVVEEGGFLYDSDTYNDDLPYWTKVHGKTHLVVPYSLVVNDARYIMGTGYGSPEHFYETAKACLDRLRNDGDDCGRMMSIGLHLRMIGRPGRIAALDRIVGHMKQKDGAWFATRRQIAEHWLSASV